MTGVRSKEKDETRTDETRTGETGFTKQDETKMVLIPIDTSDL